jgi:aminodeoxychorismate lyase
MLDARCWKCRPDIASQESSIEYPESDIEKRDPVIVFLNGQFVPETEARVSVFDRSFQYGDGLFEAIRISNGKPFRWRQHLERLERGARFLQIPMPVHRDDLDAALPELVRANGTTEGVARIALSRGVGRRGYSPRGADQPTLAVSLHPAEPMPDSPLQWTLCTASLRLNEEDALACFKTSNKLPQILARMEAEQNGCDEALLLNTRGELCETSSGNLFWIEGDTLHTPPLAVGILPGITRDVVMALAPTVGLSVLETRAQPGRLRTADGALATLSSHGIIEVCSVGGEALPISAHTKALHTGYLRQVTDETLARP